MLFIFSIIGLCCYFFFTLNILSILQLYVIGNTTESWQLNLQAPVKPIHGVIKNHDDILFLLFYILCFILIFDYKSNSNNILTITFLLIIIILLNYYIFNLKINLKFIFNIKLCIRNIIYNVVHLPIVISYCIKFFLEDLSNWFILQYIKWIYFYPKQRFFLLIIFYFSYLFLTSTVTIAYCENPDTQCVYWPKFLGGFDNYPLVAKYIAGVENRIYLANSTLDFAQFNMSTNPNSRDAQVIKTLCKEALNEYAILKKTTFRSLKDIDNYNILLDVNNWNGLRGLELENAKNGLLVSKGFTKPQILIIHELSQTHQPAIINTSTTGSSFKDYITYNKLTTIKELRFTELNINELSIQLNNKVNKTQESIDFFFNCGNMLLIASCACYTTAFLFHTFGA